MVYFPQDLNLDIGDTKEKLRILQQAQIALPAANDVTAARSYGWTEIEKLQQTLSSSIKVLRMDVELLMRVV